MTSCSVYVSTWLFLRKKRENFIQNNYFVYIFYFENVLFEAFSLVFPLLRAKKKFLVCHFISSYDVARKKKREIRIERM